MSRDVFSFAAAPYVFLERDGEFFLIRRANTGWADGSYTAPAGHMDGGETIHDAAIREVMEEAGVKIQAKDLNLIGVVHRPYNRENNQGVKEALNMFFVVKGWEGEPHNAEPHKADDAGWFKHDALPDTTLPAVKDVLAEYKAGKTATVCYDV